MTRMERGLWLVLCIVGIPPTYVLAMREPGGAAITACVVVVLVWLCPDRRRA